MLSSYRGVVRWPLSNLLGCFRLLSYDEDYFLILGTSGIVSSRMLSTAMLAAKPFASVWRKAEKLTFLLPSFLFFPEASLRLYSPAESTTTVSISPGRLGVNMPLGDFTFFFFVFSFTFYLIDSVGSCYFSRHNYESERWLLISLNVPSSLSLTALEILSLMFVNSSA